MSDTNGSGPSRPSSPSSREQPEQQDHHPQAADLAQKGLSHESTQQIGGLSASASEVGPSLTNSSNPNESNNGSSSLDIVDLGPAPIANMSIDNQQPQKNQPTSQAEPSPNNQSELVPPVGTESYPWNRSWEEAKRTRSPYRGRNPWTVAADLFFLQEVPKYYAAAKGERMLVAEQILAEWQRWDFGFQISVSGITFRYGVLKRCIRENPWDRTPGTEKMD